MTTARRRTEQDILDELTPLLVQVFEEGRPFARPGDHLYDYAPERPQPFPASMERSIQRLMDEALAAGLTPAQIASRARISVRDLFGWIKDVRVLAEAHNGNIVTEEQRLAKARFERAQMAANLLREPEPHERRPKMTKVDVAKLFGVSRPTLDEWLRLYEEKRDRSALDVG